MTNIENALFWLYVKTWGKFGEHVMNDEALWTFSAEDLRTVLMDLAYPRKRKFEEKEKSERVKALTDLIMEKFENDMAFHKWSLEIHQENIENLPEIPQQESIKIVKWDPGKYFTRFRDFSIIGRVKYLLKYYHILPVLYILLVVYLKATVFVLLLELQK